MKNKRIALMLAVVLILASSVNVLAAEYDFHNLVDSSKSYGKLEFAASNAKRLEVGKAPSNYAIEAKDGSLYKLAEVTAKIKEGKTFNEAIEELKPISKPSEGLKVVEVSAINSTQAEVKFNMEVKEVKPANFKVTDKDGNLVFVSKVELNEAKDVATLTFVSKFADKATYNVEISNVTDVDGNVMERATEAFTYVAAEVAKVEFTQTTVGHNTDLRKVVKVTDKLGRDVTSEHNIEFESSNTNVVPTNGIIGNTADGSAIVVAKVQVGDNWVKSAPTTISVKKSAAATFVGAYVYTGEAAADTEKFAELKDEEKINYVYENDKTSKLALYYNDQYGNELNAVTVFNDTNKPALENLTPAVVVVDNIGTITPVSVGEGYVKVTNGDVVTTVKIVVREESAIQSMEVEKNDVSVVENISDTVKITFKDQFGTKIDATPTEVKSSASAIATAEKVENGVLITGVKEGTATVEVTYKDEDNKVELKETINVTVTKAADLATYEAVVNATKLDINGVNDDKDKLPKSTNVVVNKIDANGNKIGEVATADIALTEVDKDGKAVAEGKELLAIVKPKVTAARAGTAYVEVKVGTLVIDTLEFEVVNTESTPTTVEFTRNDLAYVANYNKNEFSFKLVGSDDKYTHEALKKDLETIIKVKDQYGKDMKMENVTLIIDPLFTNLNGLKLDSTGVKLEDVTKATATLDIVVKEIKVGNGDNLISEPVVIKVVVDAKSVAEAIEDAALKSKKALETFAKGNGANILTYEVNGNNLTIDVKDAANFAEVSGSGVLAPFNGFKFKIDNGEEIDGLGELKQGILSKVFPTDGEEVVEFTITVINGFAEETFNITINLPEAPAEEGEAEA